MTSKNRHAYQCPVEATISVAGGKWKPMIIFYLLQGKYRFGELKRLMNSVTQRSLTLQLRELENDGIVLREIFAEVPPRVEYSLTELGRSLEPVMLAMKKWGDVYVEQTDAIITNSQFAITK